MTTSSSPEPRPVETEQGAPTNVTRPLTEAVPGAHHPPPVPSEPPVAGQDGAQPPAADSGSSGTRVPAAQEADGGDGTSKPPVRSDPEEIRQDIDRTREELGAVVEELVAKTDVRARARTTAQQLSHRLQDTATSAGQHLKPVREKLTAGSTADALRDQAAGGATALRAAAPALQRATSDKRRTVLVTALGVAAVVGWLTLVRRKRH